MSVSSSTVLSKFVRLTIVLLTGFIVLKVPNFGQLMALFRASYCTCTLLALSMPALCHLVLFREEADKFSKMLDYILVVLGVTGAVIGTWGTAFNS